MCAFVYQYSNVTLKLKFNVTNEAMNRWSLFLFSLALYVQLRDVVLRLEINERRSCAQNKGNVRCRGVYTISQGAGAVRHGIALVLVAHVVVVAFGTFVEVCVLACKYLIKAALVAAAYVLVPGMSVHLCSKGVVAVGCIGGEGLPPPRATGKYMIMHEVWRY